MLEVDRLTKQYGAATALRDVSFRAEHGQTLGFLGPTGAGKSTTMKIIAGYIGKSGGAVRICGLDTDAHPHEAKRHIGFLPEDTPLPHHMTVTEFLEYASDLKMVPANEKFGGIDDIMDLTGLSHVRNRLIRNLSNGYKQRVGIAQALVGFPEALILDEPTAGLDPSQIIDIRALVRELGKSHTLIFSSHILSEVESICDKAVIICKGRVLADSPLTELAGGSPELTLTLLGSHAAALAVVGKIDGATVVGGGEAGDGRITFTLKTSKEVRPNLFYALAEAKLPILELSEHIPSLEDTYIRLVNAAEEDGGA
jgi:ABC-2 type transport system ATP-binding protein